MSADRLRAATAIALGLAFVVTGSAFDRAIAQAIPFSNLYYEPTTGKVGYHMQSEVHAYVYDVPGQNYYCQLDGQSVTSSGIGPPGLTLPADNPGHTYFEGTPQQPGDWTVYVTWHGVHCHAGADQNNYGDRTITVHFHIDGDAPRGVN